MGKGSLPLRLLAWLASIVLGLALTWFVASTIGFISRSQIVDMFRSSGPTNYTRLFLLVPVWAFMTACIATLLIEGTRAYTARRAQGPPPGPRPPSRPAMTTRVSEVDESAASPREPRPPLPPGERTRIRPREPTV
jgi:hypothetical protein